MNAPEIEQSPYTASAYNSTAIPIQPPHKWQQDANRSNLRRTQLRWGHYANLQPWQVVDMQLQANEHTFVERTGETELYCDQQRWRFENFNKLLILIPFLKYLSLFMAPWFFWMFATIDLLPNTLLPNFILVLFALLMIGVSGWLYWEKTLKAYLIQVGAGLATALLSAVFTYNTSSYGTDLFWFCGIMAFSIFMGVVGFDFLLDLYLRLFKYDGSEFNRQTGMVTIARRFRKPFVAPFYEFDATMEFRPGPHGSGGMALWLHHRYADCDIFLGGKLHPLGLTPEEALAFWDCLQRYMDVSQPLPELPILEQLRHLDPVTAEYDRQNKRDPRRWRDLPYRAWEGRGQSETMKRNQNYPWQQQPCILQAKIDPSLSIETYYRDQETKGIQATPKADDFDNTHRH
ncbi:hypothetical protein FBY03_102336 [Pseudomonas sp. SJZ079]|uniref:nucleoporin NDC1 n=1 Tax=Pseudomonas sp. SJZ079 TaxID=2572887 RepID=UPI00119C42FC|nr:nucleoporin NDC1 [Pseudomonas sp. SJZ079]TWC41587.1 hypothetical protein FBY03_102336 [Pseudomonas sp. SJZ079]